MATPLRALGSEVPTKERRLIFGAALPSSSSSSSLKVRFSFFTPTACSSISFKSWSSLAPAGSTEEAPGSFFGPRSRLSCPSSGLAEGAAFLLSAAASFFFFEPPRKVSVIFSEMPPEDGVGAAGFTSSKVRVFSGCSRLRAAIRSSSSFNIALRLASASRSFCSRSSARRISRSWERRSAIMRRSALSAR